ncbi:MAG: sulfur carrier protein ThiS [Amphiplicatus sp.]
MSPGMAWFSLQKGPFSTIYGAMRLTINGEKREFAAPMSVAGLLCALALEPRKIAVERNLEIVPKSAYAATALGEGDRIEIVQFVGGG